jgi:hypothetical protein
VTVTEGSHITKRKAIADWKPHKLTASRDRASKIHLTFEMRLLSPRHPNNN